MSDRITAALDRQRQLRSSGSVTMPSEQAWADAEALAAEVERLRHIIASLPGRETTYLAAAVCREWAVQSHLDRAHIDQELTVALDALCE